MEVRLCSHRHPPGDTECYVACWSQGRSCYKCGVECYRKGWRKDRVDFDNKERVRKQHSSGPAVKGT